MPITAPITAPSTARLSIPTAPFTAPTTTTHCKSHWVRVQGWRSLCAPTSHAGYHASRARDADHGICGDDRLVVVSADGRSLTHVGFHGRLQRAYALAYLGRGLHVPKRRT